MGSDFTHAIVRKPGPNAGDGLTTAALGALEPERCLDQHAAYVDALESLGLQVTVLPADPAFPDGWFVEDVAIVTAGLAVVTRPGAPPRLREGEAVAAALARHRPLHAITRPATLEGGDVLMLGRTCFVGLSARSNDAGAEQLAQLLAPEAIEVVPVPVGDTLHLKSDINLLDGETLLATRAMAARPEFGAFRIIEVPDAERYAANVLAVNGTILMAAGFPVTRDRLDAAGYTVRELPMDQARCMDGGLTCLSLRFGSSADA